VQGCTGTRSNFDSHPTKFDGQKLTLNHPTRAITPFALVESESEVAEQNRLHLAPSQLCEDWSSNRRHAHSTRRGQNTCRMKLPRLLQARRFRARGYGDSLRQASQIAEAEARGLERQSSSNHTACSQGSRCKGARERSAVDPCAVFNRVDHRAPQMIGRRVLQRTQRLDRSYPSRDPCCSIKKGVDVQTTSAAELQVPLLQSVGLMASPCVTDIGAGSGTGLIHGMAECDVSCSS